MRISIAIATALLTGCSSLPSDLRKAIPDGQWKEVKGTISGKFSTTKFEATGVVKKGKLITAESLTVRHSDPWITNLEFDATGFSLPAPAPKK